MITGVIARFATGTYTVTRADAEVYVDGYKVSNDESTCEIVASIQPEGATRENAAPAQSSPDNVMIYTVTGLNPRSENGPGDRVAYRGVPYEVTSVQRWEAFGESFCQARAARTVLP